jgi:hypothetical protein
MPTTYDQIGQGRVRLFVGTQFDRPFSDMISGGGTSGGITARERIAEGIIRALLVLSEAESGAGTPVNT